MYFTSIVSLKAPSMSYFYMRNNLVRELNVNECFHINIKILSCEKFSV